MKYQLNFKYLVLSILKAAVMEIKKIENKKQYLQALKRFEVIFQANANTQESNEADTLALLIEDYEKLLSTGFQTKPQTLDEYNKDLSDGEIDIENGDFVTNEQLKKDIRQW